ncbi:MAG: ERCC4 domain-containing protein, partial [Nanoarchaeota archaeon]
FTNNNYNVIVSSSVGEEGLDIPQVDLVIFYEPIPSAIRSIQRRGRTARLEKGRVIVLMTKNTRDEMYYWVSFHKEKRMNELLSKLKERLQGKLEKPQSTLKEFTDEKKLKVFADSRERGSTILKELINLGLSVETKNLDVADYIISERVGIERKDVKDFVNSIIDKRLFSQIKNLKENFSNPLIILEGEEDIYSVRNIHPNAIRGMLATIAISFGIPIIRTKNQLDTAELIKVIAKREQDAESKDIGVRLEKKPLTTKEQQEFIIESLPGIGPSLAKSLLLEFKTVKSLINAEPEKIQKVDKMGPKKTEEIIRILNEFYERE